MALTQVSRGLLSTSIVDNGNATAITIDSSENVGIGTGSPSEPLTVLSAQDYQITAAYNATNSTSYGYYGIKNNNTGNPFYFNVGGAERMRLDASGNLLVGKTVTSSSTAGMLIGSNGRFDAVRDGGYVGYFNRLSSNGDIALFAKDGTTVGSIGTAGGDVYLSNGTKSLLLTGSLVLPRNGTGGISDGTVDLGNGSNRFKDLYLSGGVYLGGTAADNKLDYYEETTWTPTQSGVTLSVSVAKAVRIGNLVTLACRVAFPSNSDSTLVGISGLPFTRDTNWQSAGAVMATFADLPSGYTQLNYFIGGSTIQLYAGGDDLGWDALTNSDMSGGQIILNVTYQTNA